MTPVRELRNSHERCIATIAKACTGLVSFGSNIPSSAPLRVSRLYGAPTGTVPVLHAHRLTHLDLGYTNSPLSPAAHPNFFVAPAPDTEERQPPENQVDLSSADVLAVLPALTHLAVHFWRCGVDLFPAVLRNRRLVAVLVYSVHLNYFATAWQAHDDARLEALLDLTRGDERVRFAFTPAPTISGNDIWEGHIARGDSIFMAGKLAKDVFR
ncbi:hypothetical protein EXIGLDRAFT_735667 [Exidia glandulosa HHB12029]|uniref:Uncharacterized protein n=1 Tax=Exidia glandulosa HHB12029 TaxID=1314781 RepID=A0A165PHI6_EXIGL|nr:hypothetical protein EXIGLDRAFT_735667 [Exidia glandulosa HHB12029]